MTEVPRYNPNDKHFFDILLEGTQQKQRVVEALICEYYGLDEMGLEDWYRIPIPDRPFNNQIPAITILDHPNEVLEYVRALTGKNT